MLAGWQTTFHEAQNVDFPVPHVPNYSIEIGSKDSF